MQNNRHCEPTGRTNARLMTGSAKQSRIRKKARMDCFASLAMTCNPDTVIPGWSAGPDPESRDSGFDAEPVIGPRFARTRWHRDGVWSAALAMTALQLLTRLRDLAARCARALQKLFRPVEGVGNAGCPLHPRPRVHFVVIERTRVTTSTPESPGIPARNGFNSLCRALPGDRALCHRRPQSKVLSKPGWAKQNSANLTPASGRQDHTILPYAKSVSRPLAW